MPDPTAKKPVTSDDTVVYEFGGPLGACFFIPFSLILPIYIWYVVFVNNGSLTTDFMDIWHKFLTDALPTYYSFSIYAGFILYEGLLCYFVPIGVLVYGLPLADGTRLPYFCNAFACWLITLATVLTLHFTRIFSLTIIVDEFPRLLLSASLFSNLYAIYLYVYTVSTSGGVRMSGNVIYDFFMGAPLNPRIGIMDLKMFAEARVSWLLLILLDLGAAFKQYEVYGRISWSMMYFIFAQGIYTHAIMKGEESIPTTWDMFYEKFGWLLIYWNLCGVPFVYCIQSFYILKHTEEIEKQLPNWVFVILFIILLTAYYVWDTSMSQRCRFRAIQAGGYQHRSTTFPQLPWGTLRNPRYLTTKCGSTLLIDGWWKYVRKPHYTSDIIMNWTWGICCGFHHFIPYFYPIFFFIMILHRNGRDVYRCKRKYKEDWDRYCEIVPYEFIPYIY